MSENEYEKHCLALESLIKPLGRSVGADVERRPLSVHQPEWCRVLMALNWKLKSERL
ncbi:hypothetical protein [Burkholderia cenocepacia]|uniref:hypothetical protein n=1 Tax=Burkholderia cenocepacia TaxID=95486 RepID=UPI0012B54A35|nr:hypothetical protein [Burkholderia cenocepacia]